MTEGYYVRFTKTNGEVEEYFYWGENEAWHHFELFRDDDSGLYEKIELESYSTGEIIGELVFKCETGNRTEVSESERESVLHEEILHTLCEAITLMDKHQEYGMGDELFEAVIALKHEWGIPYDYDEEADEREIERRI